MYSRVTLLEIDTIRVDVDDAVALFESRSCPASREQHGYEGVAVLATPEGKGMIVTLLGQRGGGEASAGFAASARRGVRHALPLAAGP